MFLAFITPILICPKCLTIFFNSFLKLRDINNYLFFTKSENKLAGALNLMVIREKNSFILLLSTMNQEFNPDILIPNP